MGQEQKYIGHIADVRNASHKTNSPITDSFVLEKSIFSNVFEKDIKRIYIYKKAERLAKALHLIAPAFDGSFALEERMDTLSVDLVEAAILPSRDARTALSRTLLLLSSMLSIARTNGMLSTMNADLISHEAHLLLQEIAEYEEPRVALEETPSLAELAKTAPKQTAQRSTPAPTHVTRAPAPHLRSGVGNAKDTVKDTGSAGRRGAILDVLKNKTAANIKDISTHIRDVSEKTIQRELISLIEAGLVRKEGERRWSTYSLA